MAQDANELDDDSNFFPHFIEPKEKGKKPRSEKCSKSRKCNVQIKFNILIVRWPLNFFDYFKAKSVLWIRLKSNVYAFFDDSASAMISVHHSNKCG